MPLVSICLPTLNSRSYLPARLASIRAQIFADWELIVADSYSDDGSWETLGQFAGEDTRVRLFQMPKDGIYPALNFCVERAVGRYVYFAMSDDSMAPDCLEKMAAALQRHPTCHVAHCRLRLDDANAATGDDWWLRKSMLATSTGSLLVQPHIRHAPFDGLLHLGGETVYVSLTQLLIRRTLFEKIGLFESRWGACGDFNWGMRAGLVADAIHVPDTWASWRLHDAQATAKTEYYTPRALATTDEMIHHAIQNVASLLETTVAHELEAKWDRYTADRRRFFGDLRRIKRRGWRFLFLLGSVLIGRCAAREYLSDRLHRRPEWPRSFPPMVRGWLQSLNFPPSMSPIE